MSQNRARRITNVAFNNNCERPNSNQHQSPSDKQSRSHLTAIKWRHALNYNLRNSFSLSKPEIIGNWWTNLNSEVWTAWVLVYHSGLVGNLMEYALSLHMRCKRESPSWVFPLPVGSEIKPMIGRHAISIALGIIIKYLSINPIFSARKVTALPVL